MSDRSTIVKVKNSLDTTINPATLEKQDELIASVEALGGLIIGTYDYIGAAYPDTVTEVYTFKTGGSSGTTIAIITVVYTDITKDFILSVTSV